jgi:hypothetical protein
MLANMAIDSPLPADCVVAVARIGAPARVGDQNCTFVAGATR